MIVFLLIKLLYIIEEFVIFEKKMFAIDYVKNETHPMKEVI